MSKPSSPASRTSSVLTTPFVASGTKAGVRTSPWASSSVPVRANEPGSRVRMAKDGTAAEPSGAPEPSGARGRAPPGSSPRSRLDALGGAVAADLDAARLALLRLGDPHLEHS